MTDADAAMANGGGGRVLRAALRGLSDQLRTDLSGTRALRAAEERSPLVAELLDDLERQLERATESAVICLVGSTGAGKSTLLNALVGRDVATEGIDRPTTSAPVIYRPAGADVSALTDGLPGDPPRVVTYEAQEGGPASTAFWRGQVLIDAPDVNSVETVHREVVAALCARSDVLVVVAHRQSIAELSSATFVDLFAERRALVFVLGRRDELDGGSRAALVGQLEELRDERWRSPDARVVTLSAKEGKERPGGGGVDELQGVLVDLIREERLGTVRRHNALGSVAGLARLAREAQEESSAALDRLATALESGAADWCGELTSAVRERLDVRRADLAEMLWNDAAKAWDGPGGYALRVGGLSAIGMGAGAAVARRNPLLAAGLAVGSVAADRMRGAVRERQFESTSGLLPAASEVERTHRDAFVQARLAADEAFATPDALTPDPVHLDGAAARAVDEAWDRVLRVDLPREAARGVPRWARWAVDLPVFAMGAWILVRVVEGFAQDDYVGFDFLMSALIIAFGWLFLARWLLRARLSARSSRLLAGVREDVEQRIGAAAVRAIERPMAELEHARRSLANVAAAEATWRTRLWGERS